MTIYRFLSIALAALLFSGCLRKQEHPDPPANSLSFSFDKPMTQEQSTQIMQETGKNWLYGSGFGETIINVGGIVLYPPFALYLLGNAGLSLAGYEPLHFSDALPEPASENWDEGYKTISEAPGKGAAFVADEKFRDPVRARMSIEKILKKS